MIAVDIEFLGFAHFRGWDGNYNSPARGCDGLFNMKYPDGSCMNVNTPTAKDLCAADPYGNCNAIGDGTDDYTSVNSFRQMNLGSSYDLYLAFNKTIIQHAPCRVEGEGCEESKFGRWLACSRDVWVDEILVSYNLPPALIHSSCLQNPKCVGFRIKTDMSGGDLLGTDVVPHATGFFAAPWTTLQSMVATS